MKLLPKLALLLAPLLLAAPASSQSSTNLVDALDTALDAVTTSSLSSVIDPFITLAMNADSLAVSALEIAANKKGKDIWLDDSLSLREKGRQSDALEEIKSKLNRIKQQRAAAERKAKEDGWDPFFGLFGAGVPLQIPGTNDFRLLPSTWLDLPGDRPPVAAVHGVTPTFAGNQDYSALVRSAAARLNFTATATPRLFDVDISILSAQLDPFEVIPGISTGRNRLALAVNGSPPCGQLDATTNLYELRFEATITNDIYSGRPPIMVFARMTGQLDPVNGTSFVSLEDPMLVPAIGPAVTRGKPEIMGAHVLSFDAATQMLTLLENTSLEPSADVAMVRYDNGTYEVDPSVDQAISSRLVIDPMRFRSETVTGEYLFSDSRFSVVDDGGTVLMTGQLRAPTLSTNTGAMFADVEIDSITSTSLVLREMAGYRIGYMQIAAGPAAFDIAVMTRGFQRSGELWFPALFHLCTQR